ncbi:uncharacterized protein LOC135392291 [Ornithodoros turicata]|uniref:uncharacterized protein LOC135392291 n=1 Tax=Ornithodoros turicata TaxID=34597 RepID=UPI0031394E7C
MLICHPNDSTITAVWKDLNKHFELKDLGHVSHYLGIEIERSGDNRFLLHQRNRITSLLEKYKLGEAKGCAIPMDADYPKLTGDDDVLQSNEIYRQAVGELLYLSTTTRPDIACAMGYLCRHVSKPRQRDWTAVKKVFRYLKYTLNCKLQLSGEGGARLVCYADADWAGDVKDRKSTSGYFISLGGSPVSWSSRKQTSVALSSTEAEYVSAAHASQEVLWLRQLLIDFGHSMDEPTCLLEDN